MFIYLTPFIPLSFEGEGEVWVLKGLHPFKLPLISDLFLRGVASLKTYLLLRGQNTKGESKRGEAPLT